MLSKPIMQSILFAFWFNWWFLTDFYWWFLTHLWRLQDRVDYHVDIPGLNHWKIIRAIFHIIFHSILVLHYIILWSYSVNKSIHHWSLILLNIKCLWVDDDVLQWISSASKFFHQYNIVTIQSYHCYIVIIWLSYP